MLYFLLTTLLNTWHTLDTSKKMLSEFSISPTFHIILNGPHPAAWQNHTYLSKLSSDGAIPDYSLLCAPTHFHSSSSIAFVTFCLCTHLFSFLGWKLSGDQDWFITTCLLYGAKHMADNKCTLNWAHGSTLGIVKFQNKKSYKLYFLII